MKTINTSVNSAAWVNLNTVTGIAVGTPVRISNHSQALIHIQEGTTAPTSDREGEMLSAFAQGASTMDFTPTDALWGRAIGGSSSRSLALTPQA